MKDTNQSNSMWEGFPDDGGDKNGPVRPMKVWEVVYMLGGMAMAGYAVYGLIQFFSEK